MNVYKSIQQTHPRTYVQPSPHIHVVSVKINQRYIYIYLQKYCTALNDDGNVSIWGFRAHFLSAETPTTVCVMLFLTLRPSGGQLSLNNNKL